jgi:hypothetical protein
MVGENYAEVMGHHLFFESVPLGHVAGYEGLMNTRAFEGYARV